jgi:hypothetical protein
MRQATTRDDLELASRIGTEIETMLMNTEADENYRGFLLGFLTRGLEKAGPGTTSIRFKVPMTEVQGAGKPDKPVIVPFVIHCPVNELLALREKVEKARKRFDKRLRKAAGA